VTTSAIQTERLELIPLTLKQLRLGLTDPGQLGRELGLAIAQDVITDRVCRAIVMKIAKMEHIDPKQHPWYTYWLLVVVDQQCGVGLVGFKGSPDSEGEVEIGCGIAPAYRGQGYTTEAVRTLMTWAFDAPECVSVIAAEVDKANIASIRILEKVGMSIYKETNDNLYWHITRDVANIKKPLRQKTQGSKSV